MTTKTTKFNIGDKVRVIEMGAAGLPIGTEAKVFKLDSDGDVYLDIPSKRSEHAFYLAKRLELISPKPTKNQRISMLEQKVEAMQAEIDALKAAQKAPKITVQSDATKIAEEIAARLKVRTKRTPNEQRKAIIAEAKAFVEKYGAVRNSETNKTKDGTQTARAHYYETEFRVKGTKVTAVIYRLNFGKSRQGKPSEIGRAKCAPGDVFNADIGRAIALGHALGLDVSKFEKAVQPSEVVNYMKIVSDEGVLCTVTPSDYYEDTHGTKECQADSPCALNGTITDDTEAQY